MDTRVLQSPMMQASIIQSLRFYCFHGGMVLRDFSLPGAQSISDLLKVGIVETSTNTQCGLELCTSLDKFVHVNDDMRWG